MFSMTFSPETVKRLKAELATVYARGDQRTLRRLLVLMMLAGGWRWGAFWRCDPRGEI